MDHRGPQPVLQFIFLKDLPQLNLILAPDVVDLVQSSKLAPGNRGEINMVHGDFLTKGTFPKRHGFKPDIIARRANFPKDRLIKNFVMQGKRRIQDPIFAGREQTQIRLLAIIFRPLAVLVDAPVLDAGNHRPPIANDGIFVEKM